MLSSVTNFLFGGPTEPEPNNEVDLQTKPAPEEDQEWIMVDVPAGGTSPTNIEMSPMENLLIEHPSMSVYNSRCSGSTGDASDLSESSNDSEMAATRKNPPRQAKHAVVRQAPRKPNAIASRAGMEAQISTVKSSQKSLKHSESKKLSRRNLQRLNRTLNHQMGGGKPYNKSGRIHTPSNRGSSH